MPRGYTKKTKDAVKYPNLYKTIYEDFGSMKAFCDAAYISHVTLIATVCGRRETSKTIKEVFVETAGKPQEWLFKEAFHEDTL
jgi:hypothetical protein